MSAINIRVNGKQHVVDVDPTTPLLWVLRDHLGMTGTKFGCGIAQCGACTVHLNGRATRSCVLPIQTLEGANITTIEGLSESGDHVLQKLWVEMNVPQCGYCQGGMLMAGRAWSCRPCDRGRTHRDQSASRLPAIDLKSSSSPCSSTHLDRRSAGKQLRGSRWLCAPPLSMKGRPGLSPQSDRLSPAGASRESLLDFVCALFLDCLWSSELHRAGLFGGYHFSDRPVVPSSSEEGFCLPSCGTPAFVAHPTGCRRRSASLVRA